MKQRNKEDMGLDGRKITRIAQGLLVLYLAVLAFLSLNAKVRPSSQPALGSSIPWDQLDHALAYSGLAVLVMLALRARGFGLTLIAVVVSAAVGVLLEFCQSWLTTTRTFSLGDVYANGVGAVLGVTVFWGFQILVGFVARFEKTPILANKKRALWPNRILRYFRKRPEA